MKQFLFCENQEGGMCADIYTEGDACEYCANAAKRMAKLFSEAPDEAELIAWLKTAEVGDMHEYRIGIWVRLKDR